MAKSVEEEIARILGPFADAEHKLLPALNAVQAAFGYLPPATEQAAALAFNISIADVTGVISFYTDYRRTPPPDVVVEVCRAEACQAAGGRALYAHASGEGDVTDIYCFGNCALAPAARVNGQLIGRATPASLNAAIEAAS